MSVYQEYLKNKDGEIISPITSADSIYVETSGGGHQTLTTLNKRGKLDYFRNDRKKGSIKINENIEYRVSEPRIGLLGIRIWRRLYESIHLYSIISINGYHFRAKEIQEYNYKDINQAPENAGLTYTLEFLPAPNQSTIRITNTGTIDFDYLISTMTMDIMLD